MRLVFTTNGWEDYTFWLQADRQVLKRINRVIDDALRDPTDGIGKPEPLRHLFAGVWSRRITDEHRLVSVSYTHLDVYKRQPTGACGNGGAPGPLAHPGEEGVEAIKVALEVGQVRRGGEAAGRHGTCLPLGGLADNRARRLGAH